MIYENKKGQLSLSLLLIKIMLFYNSMGSLDISGALNTNAPNIIRETSGISIKISISFVFLSNIFIRQIKTNIRQYIFTRKPNILLTIT